MKTVVVRNISVRCDVVKRLGALGASTVHEAYGRIGLMKPYLRPAWAGGEAAGNRAVTVLAHPGDNWMIHVGSSSAGRPTSWWSACSADNTDACRDLLATSAWMAARRQPGLSSMPAAAT